MAAVAIVSWRAAVVGRWTARILGSLLVLVFLVMMIGEGLPNPVRLTWSERLGMIAWFSIVAGLLLAWKWERGGGLLAVAGFGAFMAISRLYAHIWLLWLPGGIGLLHVLCWQRLHAGAPAGLRPWRLARAAILGSLSILIAFVLLFVNEAFGTPPLMTPSLAPSAGLEGTWQAAALGVPVVLSIHPSATVTGHIGDAEIAAAHISYGRSWFGRLMHMNAPYVIRGRLSREARLSERISGTVFTLPFDARAESLDGSLFLGGQPLRVQLTKP